MSTDFVPMPPASRVPAQPGEPSIAGASWRSAARLDRRWREAGLPGARWCGYAVSGQVEDLT